jgi:CubicO group peptidase (beta-lactamase class C family)/D-alanyl-D-alanine dipeptidase
MLSRSGYKAALAPILPALLLIAACTGDERAIGPRSDYASLARGLETFIEHEMTLKNLPALSIALVDDQEIVWARGFGYADPVDSVPATANTIYRVGSVSKLFTDIGVMQLVESGELDLDVPVERYLPDFAPLNPFARDVTLRQLMSHRSGLVREPPVGHYFDPNEPTLAETVASLNSTELVYEPETRIKYSNAGIATVGYVLEATQGERFADYLERAVLEPLGMRHSAFEPKPEIIADLAEAYMWTYDGRWFEAPDFELGMSPAGSMYSSVEDLGLFLRALFAGGRTETGRVLRAETIEAMWTPQFATAGTETGYGIGFAVSELEGQRVVGHGGAIYGFATTLAALPDDRLGVVVVTSRDVANAVTDRIAQAALRAMLAVREGRPLPALRSTEPVSPRLAARLKGRYGAKGAGVELIARNDRLYALPAWSGIEVELRAYGDTLVVDDVLDHGLRLFPLEAAIVLGRDTLARQTAERPAPAPARWDGLVGEYGWDHNTLYILERDGRLHALIEWFFLYPLEEESQDVFRFPDWGLYHGERLVFSRDVDARATQVEAAGIPFLRRAVGPEGDETFRIDPVRPVEELRANALAADPPVESGEFRQPDLVELVALDSTIKLDIRYASTNNFMSSVFYSEPRAFMQRPAAEALARAHRWLKERGYGLLIHDAYRPWYVTKMFWDATPADKKIFVADPASGSRHNRGCAVDLTLYDLATGMPVEMVAVYDEFSPRSYPDYPGGTALQRWHRRLIRDAMEEQGFEIYGFEWWHFDYADWAEYPILNLTFDRITPSP